MFHDPAQDPRMRQALRYIDARRLPLACLPIAVGVDHELEEGEVEALWRFVDELESDRRARRLQPAV